METVPVTDVEPESSVVSEENLGDIEEEECAFQDIEMLLEHGVDAEDVKKLKADGINTIKGVQMTIRKKLLKLKGFDEAKIDKIKEICSKLSLTSGFMTALEVSDRRKQIFKLSTGSRKLE